MAFSAPEPPADPKPTAKRRRPVLSKRAAEIEAKRQMMKDKALRLYLDDWSMREIGAELNLAHSTVGAMVHEALRQLGPGQDTRRLRDNKVEQLLRLSKSLLPTALGEGKVKVMDQEGEVLAVDNHFRAQQEAAKTWLSVVDRLVKVSGMEEVNRVDAGAAKADPESMGLMEVERELAEFAELLRIQPGAKAKKPQRIQPGKRKQAS